MRFAGKSFKQFTQILVMQKEHSSACNYATPQYINLIIFYESKKRHLDRCYSKNNQIKRQYYHKQHSFSFIIHNHSPAHSAQLNETHTSHKMSPLKTEKGMSFVVFFTKKMSTNVIDISGFTAYYRGSSWAKKLYKGPKTKNIEKLHNKNKHYSQVLVFYYLQSLRITYNPH